MLPINKRSAPAELANAIRRVKTTRDAIVNWKNLDRDGHEATLAALLEEQGHLCAYCSRRITAQNAHVEHIVPQSAGAGADDPVSVAYDNMLAVCDGFEGSTAGLTCDRARGDTPMKVNPLKSQTLTSIRFQRNGVMKASDNEVCNDVCVTLNLNQALLVKNRRRALEALNREHDRIGRRRGSHAVESYCQRYVQEHLAAPETRLPYDDIIIYFMNRRIRAAS